MSVMWEGKGEDSSEAQAASAANSASDRSGLVRILPRGPRLGGFARPSIAHASGENEARRPTPPDGLRGQQSLDGKWDRKRREASNPG